MEELLAAAAEAMNVPASMVERSATARAEAQGVAIEDVLRAWVGGGEVAASAPVAEPTASSAEIPATPAPVAPAPAVPASSGAPMDEAAIVTAAAERMSMPESMVRRSAAARAKVLEVDVDVVLAEWAGIEASAVVPTPVAETAPVAAPAESAAPAAPAAGQAGPAMDEAAILAAAAEKMGMPESMVRRSAAARAKAQGVDVDLVLAEWAGVELSAATPAVAPAGATSAPAPVAPAPVATPAEPAPAAVATVDVEVLGGSDEGVAAKPAEPADPDLSDLEVVAAGAIPRWLAALFVLIPAFAIGYALFLPNGPNCGDAGSLAIDPVTGLAVNCDGSDFGSELVDLFSLGAATYDGAGCTACHGPNGGGIANFPAFTGGALLTTFPEGSCSTHIEWIGLGTISWPEPTYGANETPVGSSGAVMPGFASMLSAEEIAAVAIYERVAFGGQDLDAALADCGSEPGPAALSE